MKPIKTKKKLTEILMKFAGKLANMLGRKWEDVAAATINELEDKEKGENNVGNSGAD